MDHPLKARMQFSCGTLSTSFRIENETLSKLITNDVIDYFNQPFQMAISSQLIAHASSLVDGQGGREYSKVTQEITYTVLGTRVTIGVALTVRAPGLEAELGCIISQQLSQHHHLAHDIHDHLTDKAMRAKYEAEHPEEFLTGDSIVDMVAEALGEAFGGRVKVMTIGDLLS